MDAIIVDKDDGSQHRQSTQGLRLDEASVVKLPLAPESVASFEQNGDDLMIVTANGKTITIGDFFVAFGDERNELVLVDDDGIAWWGQYASGPWSDFAFAEIGADSAGAFPWGALGGLGAASAGGLAFAGGGSDDDAAPVFPALDVEDVGDDPAAGHVRVTGNSTGDYVVISYPDRDGNIVQSEPIPVGEDGSWSYDIPRDGIAEGDVEIVGTVTDPDGNPVPGEDGNPVTDTEIATLDLTGPDVSVDIIDNGQDGTLVLTFSPDTDRDSFDPAADLKLENADLGTDGTWSEDADGNQVWTATITPSGNGEVTATVTDGSYTDTAGNEGSEGYDDETFDVDGPSVTVDIVNNGQTGTVTFTFSEPVTGFEAGDVSVGNGTLSNLTQTGPNTWTATVTPEATGDVTVAVGNGSYTDLAGNPGTPGSDSEPFDRTAPTVGVEITDNGQDGTLVLTFSPDTDRDSFNPADDLDLDNADLGTDGTWSEDADGNQIWTATITPTGNGEVTATVTDGSYTDTAGNEGSEGADTETFDVDGPSVTVDIVNNGQTGTVTFTFSEPVTGFDGSDVSVGNGTLSNLTQTGPNTWTAIVTPVATGDVTVAVGDGSYTDLAGNPGTPGADSEAFDRTAPTVDVEITDNGQDGTLVLTFSPDTDRDSFDPADDLDLKNADLISEGTWSEDADGNQIWTATITPTGNGEVTATVTDGSYTDTAGNEGSEGADTETFDVDGPSVVVDIVNEGQTGTVTFTFSEPVTGFDGSDVTVGNGTLSNLTQTGPNTWTAIVTPAATGDVTVAVGDGSYTDLAGNPGTQGSDSEVFDRTAPTVGVEITDNGQDGTLVLTFSPDTDRDSFDPTADLVLDNADLDPAGGTWSEDADGNQVWTATITPTSNGEVTATVTDGSYTDTAGNEGSEGADTETFDVDGPSVVVDIDIDDDGLGGDVTFTFSEDVDGFDASDISVSNGTLSNLQKVDDHTWTARVTPEKSGGDLTVTVADESYADKVGNLGSEGADTEAFERNAPLAYEDDISLQLAGDDFMSDENFNIAFVLDFSGSVNNYEAGQMLSAVKTAGQAFFEGTTGDVKIQLVAFSSGATSTVSFSSYAEFAAQVDAWNSHRPYNDQTNYTAAINETMESYQPVDGYNNRVFFMSDGEPTRDYEGTSTSNIDHSLKSATHAAWNDFVKDNDIDVQTVGIGQGVTVPRLQDVDEADGDNHVVQVANFEDLVDELLDVLKEVDVSGNVLNGADGVAGTADDDLLGIDGGRILSIDVDGETYTYDQGRIVDHNGNQVEDGSILNVETDQGGRLVFDFETGDWTYTADPDTGMGEEDFRYVLTDDSGDTSEASLKIDVQEAGATASAARMAIETDSVEDSGDAAVQGMFHAETLGLASIDEAPAGDEDASGDHPAADDDLNMAELVYEDNVESLEAYLPEEKHGDSAAANDPQDFSDPGTASIDLNELEDHAMMVG